MIRSLGFRVGFGIRLGSLGLGCRGLGEGFGLWGVRFGARFVYLFVSTRGRPYASYLGLTSHLETRKKPRPKKSSARN